MAELGPVLSGKSFAVAWSPALARLAGLWTVRGSRWGEWLGGAGRRELLGRVAAERSWRVRPGDVYCPFADGPPLTELFGEGVLDAWVAANPPREQLGEFFRGFVGASRVRIEGRRVRITRSPGLHPWNSRLFRAVSRQLGVRSYVDAAASQEYHFFASDYLRAWSGRQSEPGYFSRGREGFR